MAKVCVMGDTHGKLMRGSGFQDGTIQVGDFNLNGYTEWQPEKDRRIAFIDGNHDHFPSLDIGADAPSEIQPGLFYVPRGWVCGKTMFIGGAESIDCHARHPGWSIFPEESIRQRDFWRAITYQGKVEAVISHTCPDFVGPMVFKGLKASLPSEAALGILWEHLRPSLWVFGHFHTAFDQVVEGTRFVCVPTLETRTLDLPLENWPDILAGASDGS